MATTYIFSTVVSIAIVFCIVIIILHLILPKLRNDIMGFSIMAHCFCMLMTFISIIAISNLGESKLEKKECTNFGTKCLTETYIVDDEKNNTEISCKILGYLLQFSIIAGSCWLHVMCQDIATTFRSFQNMVQRNSDEKFKRLVKYILFSLGLPLIICGITYLADNLLDKEKYDNIKPNIGDGNCFFSPYGYAILIFYYGPLGFVLILNLILFIFATFKIFNYMKSPELRDQPSSKAFVKKRLKLSIKLFALTGVPWTMELIIVFIGYIVPDKNDLFKIWVLLIDIISVSHPIFLFVIFCCKRKVWDMLKDRFGHSDNIIIKRLSKKMTRKNKNSNEISNGLKKEESNVGIGSMQTINETCI